MKRSWDVHRCVSLSDVTGNVVSSTMSCWGTACEHLVWFTTASRAPT